MHIVKQYRTASVLFERDEAKAANNRCKYGLSFGSEIHNTSIMSLISNYCVRLKVWAGYSLPILILI